MGDDDTEDSDWMSDDELSRAICKAAIDRGIDPNDHGVVPEAEIIIPASLELLQQKETAADISLANTIDTARLYGKWFRPFFVFMWTLGFSSVLSLNAPLTLVALIFNYGIFCDGFSLGARNDQKAISSD